MTAQLPNEIAILISEYAFIICWRCGKSNNRYLLKTKKKNVYSEHFSEQLVCKICNKKEIIRVNNTNGLMYEWQTLSLTHKMSRILNKIDSLNSFITPYDCLDDEREYIKVDKKQLELKIKKQIESKINKIINEQFITHRIASKKEIYNILYKIKF